MHLVRSRVVYYGIIWKRPLSSSGLLKILFGQEEDDDDARNGPLYTLNYLKSVLKTYLYVNTRMLTVVSRGRLISVIRVISCAHKVAIT